MVVLCIKLLDGSNSVFGISRNNLRASLSPIMRPASSSCCNTVNFCTFVSERYGNNATAATSYFKKQKREKRVSRLLLKKTMGLLIWFHFHFPRKNRELLVKILAEFMPMLFLSADCSCEFLGGCFHQFIRTSSTCSKKAIWWSWKKIVKASRDHPSLSELCRKKCLLFWEPAEGMKKFIEWCLLWWCLLFIS